MSPWHLALCSLFTGLCVSCLVAALLLRERQRMPAPAALFDRELLRRALCDSADGRKTQTFTMRMRAAGLPFGLAVLITICAISGAGVWASGMALGLGLPLAALAAAVASVLPQTLVNAAIYRHERRLEEALPPLIDGVRRGLDSGLDLGASYTLALENLSPEAAATFAPAARSLLLGRTMAESMDALLATAPSPGLQVFAAAMSIGAESGGKLNESLAALAEAIREDIRARERLAIAASEAQSTSHILLALQA